MSDSEQQNVPNNVEQPSDESRHQPREVTLPNGQPGFETIPLSTNGGSSEPQPSLSISNNSVENHQETATPIVQTTEAPVPGGSQSAFRTSSAPTDATTSSATGSASASSAGQSFAGSRAATGFSNRMDTWIYDHTSGRFVPHQLRGPVALFGPLNVNGNSRPVPSSLSTSPASRGNPASPVTATSTSGATHSPDRESGPPEFAQRLSQLFRSMTSGMNRPNASNEQAGQRSSARADTVVPVENRQEPEGSAAAQGGNSDRREGDATSNPPANSSQPTPSQFTPGGNTPASADPVGTQNSDSAATPDDLPMPPIFPFIDMIRQFALFNRGMSPDADPPPDTRRARVLLRGLPVVPKGLVRRLERVEGLLNDQGKQPSTKAADGKEHGPTADVNGKLLCLICYDPLLPEKDGVSGAEHDHLDPETKAPGMEVDRDAEEGEDDMDLDVPVDVELSPSLESSEFKRTEDTSQDESANPDAPKAAPRPQRRKYPYQEPNALVSLPCAHIFHATSCLKPWFEMGKTTCPTCRFDIDPNSDSLDLESWLGGRRRARRTQATTATGEVGGNPMTNGQGDPQPNGQPDNQGPTTAGDTESVPRGELPPELGRALTDVVMSTLMRALGGEIPNPTNPEATMTNHNENGTSEDPSPRSQTVDPSRLSQIFTDGLRPVQPTTAGHSPMSDEFTRALRDIRGSRDREVVDGGHGAHMVIDAIVMGEGIPPEHLDQPQDPDNTAEGDQAPSQDYGFPLFPIDFLRPPPSLDNMRPLRRSSSAPPTNAPPTPSSQEEAAPNPPFMAFSNPGGLQFPPGLRSTIGGSSTSSLTASSRPSTPSLRHHPYAGVRPSSMNQPASGSTSNSSGSHSAPTTSATSSPLPTQNTGPNHPPSHENDNFRVTTHSITFSFEIPGIRVQGGSFSLPRGMGTPSPASNNANTPTTGNQEQPNTNELPFPSGFIFGTGFPLGPMGPSMGPFGGGGTNGSSAGSRSRRTKKKWVLPEGASLRSVVEAKERAAGLRCDDISCWFGPEDDDEEEDEKVFKVRPERVFLSKPSSQVASGHGEPSCMHRFHPECLLVASRVADSQLNEAIDRGDEGASLEAACPFCRNHGVMSVAEWRHCKQLTEQL